MTVTTELLLQPPIGPVEADEDTVRRALPGEIGTRDADLGAARRALRDQIARLDAELGELVVSAWPDREPPARLRQRAPRLLTLGALERTRDRLAAGVARLRGELDERGREEEQSRCLREEMLLEPERHRYVRVSNADCGEPGCAVWQASPSFGLLGRLMNWWRVRISSGCPLAG